ncbi:MAG: thioredoxin family protein [Elusimicrobia bacterium]|nr:thioredoxin family protein [Elusimicrobiota bacterium]
MNTVLKIGDKAPDFFLKGVDGKTYSLKNFSSAKALVVVFSCNHCPYVQAYEDRMIQIQKDYAGKGVQFILINSNEDKNYPEDSFENMVKRSNEKQYPFPYLRDASQQTAKTYGATHTPHLFVFDSSVLAPSAAPVQRPGTFAVPEVRDELRVPAGHPEGASVLAYTGKIDDNWQNPSQVKKQYLREALDAILQGNAPAEPETYAIGCTIKWKK